MVRTAEIVEVITQQVVEVGEVEASRVAPRSQLIDVGLGSVEVMEILARLEDHYEVKIEDDSLGAHSTVRELAKTIERLLKA